MNRKLDRAKLQETNMCKKEARLQISGRELLNESKRTRSETQVLTVGVAFVSCSDMNGVFSSRAEC